jgi:hypothetical protein
MQPKFLIAFFPCFLFINSFGQFEKGTRMIGATLGTGIISSGNTDYSGPNQFPSTVNSTNTSIYISPSIGWFLNSHTVVGANLLVSYNKQKYRRSVGGITDKKDNVHTTDFGLGGFVRYYFGDFRSLKPFAHVYLNGGTGSTGTDGIYYANGVSGTDKYSYEGNSTGRFFYNTGVNLGVTKMLNTAIGLEAYVGYGLSHTQFTTKTTEFIDYGNPSSPDSKSEYETTQAFTGNALNIGLGFQIFFASKK